MTVIDPSQRLASLLRSHVSVFQQQVAAQRKTEQKSAQGRPSSDLAGVVAQRIHAIGAEDPDRKRKAFRIFLESVLLHELGPNLIQDPSFPAMVDAVQQQMEADRGLASAAEELAGVLLAGAVASGGPSEPR